MKIILESFGQKLLIMLLMFNIKIDGIHIKINQTKKLIILAFIYGKDFMFGLMEFVIRVMLIIKAFYLQVI